MPESLIIDRSNTLPKAQDYNFLRREGITLIENLSGKLWTDYNTHDPGITLLEVMCYALTDLGYRTSFSIPDIITPAAKPTAETWKKLFYTARQILPCNPLTLMDYRKLIIDTEGVRNAWIEKSDEYEVLIYLQKTQVNPATKQPYGLTYDYKKGEDFLHLRGLYKVFVEYEDDVENQEDVAKVIWQKLQFHRNLTEDFLTVTSVEYEEFPIEAIVQVSEGMDIELINAKIYEVIYDFFSPPVSFYSLEQMLEKNYSPEEIFEGPILNYGFIDTAELEKSERSKNIHLSDIINLISGIEGVIAVKKFVFQSDSQYTYTNFTEWINNVKDKQRTPKLDIEKSNITFQRSGDRNRSEIEKQVKKERVRDIYAFLKMDNLRKRLRGSEKDLAVPSGDFMDIGNYYPFQKNLPNLYGMSETFIDSNDTVGRLSIEKAANELLAERAGVNGAKLVNLLLNHKKDKDKIVKIIDNFIAGPAHSASAVIEIIDKALNDEPNDKLLKRISQEIFGKEEADMADRKNLYRYVEENPEYISPSNKAIILKQLASQKLKKPLHKINNKGEVAKLGELYKTYQVDMQDTNKKLILQLRGFLMVFEQILADYLSQLAHTAEIFSFDEKVSQTFYPQVIDEINDMEALFIDFSDYKEFHLKMIESEETFVFKRNNILDHLLSRFSESMDKYSFAMHEFAGKEAGNKLINDKTDFLADYVQVSSYRGNGYNYADPNNAWDTNNVEGLKKRICRLLGIKSRQLDTKGRELGIKNYNRKRIAPDALSIKKTTLEQNVERYIVTLVDPDDNVSVLLNSRKDDYKFESEAIITSTYILEHGYDPSLYTKEGRGEKWNYVLNRLTPENDYEPVAVSRQFTNGNERDDALEKTLKVLKDFAEDENFHIMDHILLRPKIEAGEKNASYDDVVLLPVECVPDMILSTESQKKDVPYKFKIMHTKDQRGSRNVWKLSLMKNNVEFLVVKDDFVFYKHLTRRMEHIRKLASDRPNYKTERTVDGYFTFKIKDDETVLAESKKNYRKEEDFEEEIVNLVNFLSYEMDFSTSSADESSPSFYADPYSFQVSFILPSWQRRFRDVTFRHLLEKTIYLETPSHIYPHVYWLNQNEMRVFDEAYENWTKEIANNAIPASDVVNNMINVLINLRK